MFKLNGEHYKQLPTAMNSTFQVDSTSFLLKIITIIIMLIITMLIIILLIIIIITIMEICKVPTLWLKVLNKHHITHTMYIEMENVICNLTKANA